MIGAVVITPLVGVVRVVRFELARDDFPGATVRGDPMPVAEVESATADPEAGVEAVPGRRPSAAAGFL